MSAAEGAPQTHHHPVLKCVVGCSLPVEAREQNCMFSKAAEFLGDQQVSVADEAGSHI